jgi:transposase
MRKHKEVLRLHSIGLTQQQIARSCSISQSTVHEYLKAAAAAGIAWPIPAEWDELRLQQELFGAAVSAAVAWRKNPPPDFAAIQRELQTHRNLTLQLIWEEQRESQPDGYGYSRFCELYRNWQKKLDVVLRHDHRAGEKLFVDYAGDTIPVWNPESGEVAFRAAIFVAAMGASNYTFAEATESQELRCWIGSHLRVFDFLGGLPEILVPDNLKSGVKKPCRYEPDLNPTYHEMAEHYGVAVIPARPYKARDKAKVEVGVQIVQRWILAALRKRKFFSLDELNLAIGELLIRLNQRPFRKREGNRVALFAELDQPALRALPIERYQFGAWLKTRVNLDYHVEADRHFYSVPYTLAQEEVEIRLTSTMVEILHRGTRIASHVRSFEEYKATTIESHRPRSHREHLEWTPSKILDYGRRVGPFTTEMMETILATRRHPEMGYRSCLGILRLGKTYSEDRLEAACKRAVRCRAFNYQSLKSILRNELDRVTIPASSNEPSSAQHENIRGAGYFDSKPAIQ